MAGCSCSGRSPRPTVDGDILLVLARADEEFTPAQIHTLAGEWSVPGVRKALHRLVEQGLVTSRSPSHAVYYRLNRRHVPALLVVAIARAREELLDRLRTSIASWDHPAVFVAMFGSAATGTMTAAHVARHEDPLRLHRTAVQ